MRLDEKNEGMNEGGNEWRVVVMKEIRGRRE